MTIPRIGQVSTVYASDGSVLAHLGTKDRELATYPQIPRVLVNAVIAAEDHSFWTNPGIDVGGIARALLADAQSGRIEQGGSTITEQLVKERLLDPKHNAALKLQEIVLAVRAANKLSKRQVLADYLNGTYFGEGAYGVKAAAARYFPGGPFSSAAPGKSLDELTLPDAALLAALIASPTLYDPFTHPDLALARRTFVLTQMVETGAVTRTQAYDAALTPLPTTPMDTQLGPRDGVVDEVQQLLLDDPRLGSTPLERRRAVFSGGLSIYTTIDPAAQARALDAIRSVLPDQPPFTAALVAIDPATGYVRAAASGVDFSQLQYDLATHLPGRQPGSTYKVITLAAALEAGYSPNDMVDGTSPCTAYRPGVPIWNTENAEPGGGILTLRQATADSVNCAFAHVIASLGPQAVVDMAHRLGITQPVPDYLPITLGVKEATPLEMATVAATLADDGVHHAPLFIERVVDSHGHTVVDNTHPRGTQVVAPDVVDCETDMLRGVIQDGTGTAAALDDGRDAAGKTGTTDDHGDAWFLGYTPQLATVVWMGAPQAREPMTDVGGIEVFGGTYPARVWKAFMDASLAGRPDVDLPAAGPVCDRPGASITDAGRGTSEIPNPDLQTVVTPAAGSTGNPAPTPPLVAATPTTTPAVRTTPTETPPATTPVSRPPVTFPPVTTRPRPPPTTRPTATTNPT
ncbi:MAG TPA: transglycosylase domain-containing protein [Acidimicrobiia bacterium]|nr:transglycosylase domain-containing protein [Acidimicrobiia bacterium]